MHDPLDPEKLSIACIELSAANEHFRLVLEKHGTPPLWDRQPGFATLLQTILEQQVSLASAKACFDKLTRHLGPVTPQGILRLSDAELKTIGFSRQKTSYARHLAAAVLEQTIDLDALAAMPDAEAKSELIRLKGIGEWTSDIYLLMALLRPDIMPRGDVALHTAWQNLSGGPRPSSDEFLIIAERWRPFRSTAARLLWHFYLSERRSKLSSASTTPE
jgi:DNA-3-methyladenine glycosylase II